MSALSCVLSRDCRGPVCLTKANIAYCSHHAGMPARELAGEHLEAAAAAIEALRRGANRDESKALSHEANYHLEAAAGLRNARLTNIGGPELFPNAG